MDIGEVVGSYILIMATLYILQSKKNGSFYIGATENLPRRLQEHNTGNTLSTRNKGPWQIVFVQEYYTITEAKKIEIKLKKTKSRKIIERIIKEEIIKIKV